MVITRTPFRISFFGGGTDYPIWYKNHGGGSVISTTIDKYCYIITRYLPPFFKYKYRIRYTKRELTKNLQSIKHPSVRECLKFLKINDGIELVHTSDLPAMSGLGSSSSFTVGFLHSLYGLLDKKITKKQLAYDAIHVEQNLIKEIVGSQDQVAASFGGFNKIDFYPDNKISVKPINISLENIADLEDHLLLFFTGFQRTASEIATEFVKNSIKKEKELQLINNLTKNALKALTKSQKGFLEVGNLLDEHWQVKKKLATNISTPFIDDVYQAAKEAGAVGGKVLGAGGGGFMVFFVDKESKEKVKKKLKKLLCVPFKFENSGSQIIYQTSSQTENGYKG